MSPYNRFAHQPLRHPDNPHWECHYDKHFEGMRVYHHPKGSLIKQHLKRSLYILGKAMTWQGRTFVCRMDLRFPKEYPAANLDINNELLVSFWRNLKRELAASGMKYPPCLRYLWAREQDSSDAHHYHLMLLINYVAICTVGDYGPSPEGGYLRKNLTHRVARSWARAMDWPLDEMKGLVHVCKDPISKKPMEYCLRRNDPDTLATVFYAASYLCKAYSKSPCGHGFGSSRL